MSCFDASFINFNAKHANFVKYRSLYGFSNDTRATKLVNNRFLQTYTGHRLQKHLKNEGGGAPPKKGTRHDRYLSCF